MRRTAVLCSLLCLLAACGDNTPLLGDDDGGDDDDTTAPDAGPGSPDASEPDASPDAGPEPSGVVQCATPLPAATEGSCDVVAGTGTAVVVRGNVLGDGVTFLDGEVLYDGDRFVCSGCDCSAAAGYDTATVVSCAGAAVSPGLINAHSHLNYDERWPLASTVEGGTRYNHRHDWRGGVPTPSNGHGTGQTSNGMRWSELRHLVNGETSIAASTRANGLVRNLDELEAHDTALGFKPVTYEVFELGDSNESFHADCNWNYAMSDFQVSLLPGLVTHTAEGINDYAQEEFKCQSSSIGNGQDLVEKNVGHIHGVGLTAANYFDMVHDDSKLVWSPRSNISLYGNTAAAQILARLGGTIALGTDWTYSGSATLVREMKCVDGLDGQWLGNVFSAEDVWRMATINGAKATSTDALIGSIAAGKIADLAVFRADAGETHQAVIDATTTDVLLVVRDGDAMFGEADVVAALSPTGCEDLDVCGAARRVCTVRDIATSYATIETAEAEAAGSPAQVGYPVELCETPPNEPTCVPTRPDEYAGVTETDPDGDGIAAAADNCPTVFNPIRPMDHAVQPDADADGLGDACDPTPVGTDLDGDGAGNGSDVCPLVSDNQTDGDADGKGDACDACPTTANAATVCAPTPTTIVAIQDGTVATGSDVYIEGAIVTGVRSNGFSIQDPTVTDGRYAGVWVFTSSSPGVAVGERVTVAGTSTEYFDMTEIEGAAVISHVAGTPITPVSLTIAEAATEPYEGVLVTLTDLAQIDIPYSCTGDNAACADPRLWELNDTIVAWNNVYSGTATEWDAEGTALAAAEPVTGVMSYRFNRRRIMPRTAADIGN